MDETLVTGLNMKGNGFWYLRMIFKTIGKKVIEIPGAPKSMQTWQTIRPIILAKISDRYPALMMKNRLLVP